MFGGEVYYTPLQREVVAERTIGERALWTPLLDRSILGTAELAAQASIHAVAMPLATPRVKT